MTKLVPIRVRLDGGNRLMLPKEITERIDWLQGVEAKDGWLLLIDSRHYRLLSDEEVKSDNSLSPLREWILGGRPTDSMLPAVGGEFGVLPLTLLPVVVAPVHSTWRIMMPKVLSLLAEDEATSTDFVVAFAGGNIEIWFTTALREAVANVIKPPKKAAAASGTNTRFVASLDRQTAEHICEWDVFISHASEDKDVIARPLAEALRSRGLHVWYDEFSLQVGDSLRMKIEEGLAGSRFGVVILSPSFFNKHWPQRELNGLASREVNRKKVILPLWHNVTFEIVRDHSPTLSDLVAVKTDQGLEKVVSYILGAVGHKT